MTLLVKRLGECLKRLLGVRHRAGLESASQRLKSLTGRSATMPEGSRRVLLKIGVICSRLSEIAGLQSLTQLVQRLQCLCARVILRGWALYGRDALRCHNYSVS